MHEIHAENAQNTENILARYDTGNTVDTQNAQGIENARDTGNA